MPIEPMEKDIEALVTDINCIRSEVIALYEIQANHATRLNAILADVAKMSQELQVEVDLLQPLNVHQIQYDLIQEATMILPQDVRKKLDQRYLHHIPTIPTLDKWDWTMILTVGIGAIVAENLLVGVPHGVAKHYPENRSGVLSDVLKQFTFDHENWLSGKVKTSFDQLQSETRRGLGGHTHRLHTAGHDPGILGLFIGVIDIIFGRRTGVSWNTDDKHMGSLFTDIPMSGPGPQPDIIAAILRQFGHILSDMFTDKGVPVPDMWLTLMMHNNVPGSEDTIAEVTRRMYLDGYDFRHYLSGASVPGLIELVIGLYAWTRNVKDVTELEKNYWSRGGQTIHMTRSQAKRRTLLFLTHAIAVMGNAGKVSFALWAGKPEVALSSFNQAQWRWFIVRLVHFVMDTTRNTRVLEQVYANRSHTNHILYDLDFSSFKTIEF